MIRYILLLALFCNTVLSSSSRVTIENNGYKNIFIALPPNIEEDERPKLVQTIEDMLRSSSVLLQMSTKGRAYFSEVSLLMPDSWQIAEDDPNWMQMTSLNSTSFGNSPRVAMTTEETDIVVTDKGQYPYVLHQGGCGRRALRIILPKDFLYRNRDKGRIFTRLWSEYRYGVFPEGGFPNDDKYPATYRSPSKTGDVQHTGCSDKTFWSSSLCREGDKKCEETSMTSSLMNQHLSSSAIMFCEGAVSLGPKHNAESPSKQNLLCKEEGTWFTVMKSPDFARGKNAAPKYLPIAADVSFRFVQQTLAPRFIVAIDISSRMETDRRYDLTKAAFHHFVYSTLPYGSEVALLVFGDEDGVQVAKQTATLEEEDSRILYLETWPLPVRASNTENISLAELFDKIFELSDDMDQAPSDILIVTTVTLMDTSTSYAKVKQRIVETRSRLHVLHFYAIEKQSENNGVDNLWRLCSEVGGDLAWLDIYGIGNLGDIYRGFGKAAGSFNREIQIMSADLADDVDLEIPFVVDEELTDNLKVHLFFPHLCKSNLNYSETLLYTPSGAVLNFTRRDFLCTWAVDLDSAEAGEYILKTRRFENTMRIPILLSVTGRSESEEDPVTVNVWTEVADFKPVPHPIQIFAEVRKGWHPVRGAQVVALVQHSNGEEWKLTLLDDGLGDADVTKDDGIYGRYFTAFSSPGDYKMHIKVSKGLNDTDTEVLKGPNGFCCGSSFSAVTAQSVGSFQRIVGPVCFEDPRYKFEIISSEHWEEWRRSIEIYGKDRFPPSRVTDLKLAEKYDRIFVLRWTAAGDDYDSGFADTYELKVFRDPSILRNRFSGSRQEIYSEVITTTPEAVYGTTLNHAFELPSNALTAGVYYIAIRAIDEAGNAGEPSNIVPVWIEGESPRVSDCEGNEGNCDGDNCEAMPLAERLLGGNAAKSIASYIVAICFIPSTVFVPVFSLVCSLLILNNF